MSGETGLDIRVVTRSLEFRYGEGVHGPQPELRSLAQIRRSLMDPACQGPDPVYAIAMDVYKLPHRQGLKERMLLFGVVAYAAGRLGREPVRSQGHVHRTASHSGWSPPELIEIWQGRAIVYMQETTLADPGRCYGIEAWPGDRVVVPPGWAHFVVNADPARELVFGAWCDREYGFVYEGVRERGGLAWYPVLSSGNHVDWERNPRYRACSLELRPPRPHPCLGLYGDRPIYRLFEENPETVEWVSEPSRVAGVWFDFEP